MAMATLVVPRAAASLETLFEPPPAARDFELVDVSSGNLPRLETRCWLFHDRQSLYLLVQADDDPEAVATYRRHDDPLYEEDVFEIFLAPATLRQYFEIELNHLSAVFDARIDSPDGDRRTMTADVGWTCDGLWTALQREVEPGRCRSSVFLGIPFSALGRETPKRGERWRANIFRIDRSASHGDQYSAWQPTLRSPADFHVPAAFGELVFD